jgi:tetratricopeptide (TPR) repeat protein
VTRLQNLLNACPTDLLTRFELATLLEELSRYEEALLSWKAVLSCDPNNLQAREGMARCRRQIGRPLQSSS